MELVAIGLIAASPDTKAYKRTCRANTAPLEVNLDPTACWINLSKDLSVGFMRLCGASLGRKYPKFGSRFLSRDASPCTGVVALLAI